MKKRLVILLCLVPCLAFSQNKEQQDSLQNDNGYSNDSVDYAYFNDHFGARLYNVGRMDCPDHMSVPGEPVPGDSPYAGYANDTAMWEWTTVRLADFWEERIYDLKPQYKDTLTCDDGSVIEVPVWIKYPGWVKK